MNNQQSFILLSSCLLLSSFCLAKADTIETTTTQTTTTSAAAPVFNLSASGNYFVVDPVTGIPIGHYDPVARLVDGRTLQSGLVIVDKPSGNLVATVDAAGNIVDVSVAPATEVLVVSINSRRRDLDRQIAQDLIRGQITAAQAADMRAQLDRIAANEASFRVAGGTLTYRQALVVASDLNILGQRLYPTAVVTPVVAPQFVVQDTRLTMVDNITFRKLHLSQRINDEYQAGRLSSDNVSSLKEKMDKISSLEMRSRKNGELTESKARAISAKLDQLESSLNRNVANINEERAEIGIRVN